VHFRSLSYLDILLTRLRDRRLEEENAWRSRLIFEAMVAESAAVGATVVQLFLPTPEQVRANAPDRPDLYEHGCRAAHVLCVDPTPAMHRWLAPYDDWKPLFSNHYPAGLHDVIAAEVARAIEAWRSHQP
jgi:hypothetical protein